LREFLGVEPNERTPGQSSLTRIRKRLPLDVRERMFVLALAIGQRRGLLRGGEETAKNCHPRILAYNRGVILRLLFGIAKTKTLQDAFERVFQTILATVFFCKALCSRLAGIYRRTTDGIHAQCRTNHTRPNLHFFKIALFQRTVWR